MTYWLGGRERCPRSRSESRSRATSTWVVAPRQEERVAVGECVDMKPALRSSSRRACMSWDALEDCRHRAT